MKKLLFGLSVLSLSSLSAANIELYGQAHMSADSVNNGENTTAVLASNASRLGVRANSEIAYGLSAVLQYEIGVDLSGNGSNDDGNGGNFNASAGNGNNNGFFTSARDSYVGIKSELGSVLAGNLPGVNQSIYDYNLFADQVGDLGNIWGGATPFPDRASNSLAYYMPAVVDGLSAKVSYMFDQSSTNDGNTSTGLFVKVNYEKSGFKVGLGYINIVDSNATYNPSEIALSGSYTTTSFSLGGGLKQIQNVSGVNSDKNRMSYNIGASYTLSGIKIKGQYTVLVDDVADSDASQVSLGVDYSVSKDAKVYIAYANTSNDSNSGYGPNGWGHGKSSYGKPSLGKGPSAFSLGVVYKFSESVYSN